MAFPPPAQPPAGSQTRGSWLTLPTEIRLDILDLVSVDDRNDRQVPKGPRDTPLAVYATVCSEWQHFFEKMTFRNLMITNKGSELAQFARILNGKLNTERTRNVRHLLFVVTLPGYSCTSCHKIESWFDAHRNNVVFTAAMKQLLDTISAWGPRDAFNGLTLELGFKSSSDSRHFFDDTTIHDDYPFKSWDVPNDQTNMVNMVFFHEKATPGGLRSRPCHYQSALAALARPQGFHHTERFLGSLLQFQGLGKTGLLYVNAVRSLVIRQQFKRQMAPSALGRLVNESLVYINSFRLERWCRLTTHEEEEYLRAFRKHLLPSLPSSVQSFHYYAERYKGLRVSAEAQAAKPFSVVELLDTHGDRFRQFSVVEPYGTGSQLVELGHYLQEDEVSGCLTMPIFHNLERICFKSAHLRHGNDNYHINSLFIYMAKIAGTLPNLRSLEIFNTSREDYVGSHSRLGRPAMPSCLFRYSVESSQAELFWESIWQLPIMGVVDYPEFTFHPEVKREWESVALAHTGHGLSYVINEPKRQEPMGDAVARQRYWMKHKGKPRVADDFKLDGIHPFTRVLMGHKWNRMRLCAWDPLA